MAPPAIGTVRQGTERNSRRNIPSTGIVKGAKGSASNPIILGDDLPPSTPRKPSAKIQNTRTAPFTSSKESSTKPLQQATKSPSRKRKAETESSPTAEKRARKFRPKAPQAFYPVYERALGQRFYVLKRTPTGTVECPEETFEMTGSTGNVYTVHIGRQPQCNCPHARKGNQCKHVLYILARVLHAPFDLVYQTALLSTELCTIFASEPDRDASGSTTAGKRKPVEGDCPICYCDLDADSSESVVWCRAACGQNIHQKCFQMWAATKAHGTVTCPMCRSTWEGDPDVASRVRMDMAVQSEGYANVGRQLGISGARDESTYSTWGLARRYGRF
ncbi:Znf1 [Purpureocillium lilacinum]|uniref:Znf1 n=1 Tax=Purpureocillium lilacinum TaxID=33203 RepID=A0A179GNM3_PURLI|nr:Znf1 [Purpureocillium lilacinum]OAQ76414.1 Znf1 [Purpureocillium lilacinum]OAQ79494.1 Znf1 [Purpureocillium lilacinum]GJN70174.1 hypothetical protein PLICBS_004227 [Purpureocillium lilacinum]GJN79718.1 hypothetical protein PLIIFM63780_003236 [Purpureocillium lilacinum]